MAKVSIGLPVYNGQNYVEEAVRSVMSQSFPDWELVISDNASTDGTESICRALADEDQRIRYIRNATNIGAAANYNRAWEEGRGVYFKWLAHDDRIKKDYLAATVGVLDARPEVVLANTTVDYIDGEGKHLGYYRAALQHTDVESAAARFEVMTLRSHTCVDLFGLVRRDAMVGSLLHQSFSGADKAFLAQMSLRGRMVLIDEPLVEMREHESRYTRATKNARAKLAWHDPSKRGQIDVPVWTLYSHYRAMVEEADLPETERRACRRVLRRFWLASWNGGRLIADLLSVPFPGAVSWAWRVKYRLFGAPGNFVSR